MTVGDGKQIGVGVGPAHQPPYVQFLATPLHRHWEGKS